MKSVRILSLFALIALLPAVFLSGDALSQSIETDDIAVYGEIQQVNTDGSTFTVQYYDYDSDSEKTSDVFVVSETILENAKTLGEVRKGDWADVTYVVKDGKNLAKIVSIEKEEPTPDLDTSAMYYPDYE